MPERSASAEETARNSKRRAPLTSQITGGERGITSLVRGPFHLSLSRPPLSFQSHHMAGPELAALASLEGDDRVRLGHCRRVDRRVRRSTLARVESRDEGGKSIALRRSLMRERRGRRVRWREERRRGRIPSRNPSHDDDGEDGVVSTAARRTPDEKAFALQPLFGIKSHGRPTGQPADPTPLTSLFFLYDALHGPLSFCTKIQSEGKRRTHLLPIPYRVRKLEKTNSLWRRSFSFLNCFQEGERVGSTTAKKDLNLPSYLLDGATTIRTSQQCSRALATESSFCKRAYLKCKNWEINALKWSHRKEAVRVRDRTSPTTILFLVKSRVEEGTESEGKEGSSLAEDEGKNVGGRRRRRRHPLQPIPRVIETEETPHGRGGAYRIVRGGVSFLSS